MVVSAILFLVEDYSSLSWGYVFARILDTLVGVLAVAIVSILFWRIDKPRNLLDQEKNLKDLLCIRLEQTKQWLTTSNNIELDLMPLKCSQLCRKFTAMAGEELRAHPKSHRRLALGSTKSSQYAINSTGSPNASRLLGRAELA